MKKLYVILIAMAWTTVQAQTLTSSTIPPLGTSISNIEVDATSLSEGSGGTGQTWNFSSVTATGNLSDIEYISPVGTPNAGNFASSNLCQRVPDGSGGFVYSYYYYNANLYELHGVALSISGTPLVFTYANPMKGLQFPCSNGTTFTDAFTAFYTVNISGTTINNYRTGSVTTTADGSGTLVTPNGTYSNILRVKIVQTNHDSTVYVGIPVPAVVQDAHSTTYNWFGTNAGSYVNQFYLSYDSVFSASGNTDDKTAYYQDAITVGLNGPALMAEAAVSVYPNPATDHASIVMRNTVQGLATCNIFDSNGRIVKSLSTSMPVADRFEWSFPTIELSAGLYHAQVICQDRQWTANILIGE